MKICFITSNVFSLGGVQRVLSVVASELAKYHTVDILCTSNKTKINRNIYKLDDRVNIFINGYILKKDKFGTKLFSKIGRTINDKTGILNNSMFKNILKNSYYPIDVQKNLINYLNRKNYDIVIGVEGEYSLLLGAISDKINMKTIGWQHNSYDAYLNNKNRYFWNQDILFSKLIPKLDKYIVLTEYDKKTFKEKNKIECDVLYNPRSFKSEEKSNVESKNFLAAGRFTYQKGFDLLIESFNIFARENSDWNLIIVGEGEEYQKLNLLIDKFNLRERISIHPCTDNIKDYFLKASCLLLSSRWEGMPMIVLESMEMGVPVIAYDITAATQIIQNNVQGLLTKKFDTSEYAKNMKLIADSKDMRKRMSNNSILSSKQFEVEYICKKWNDMFFKMLIE